MGYESKPCWRRPFLGVGEVMAKFLTELDVHCINGDKIWELDASLIYKSDYFK